jgi:PPM family protein phosphatase
LPERPVIIAIIEISLSLMLFLFVTQWAFSCMDIFRYHRTMQIATREVSYRKASEDRLFYTTVGEGLFIAVADGVGGRENGAEAAQFVVDMLSKQADQMPVGKRHYWSDVLHTLDRNLLGESDAGETTIVALHITPNSITGARVGDSEAWWVSGDGCDNLTEGDHKKPYLGSGMAKPLAFHHKIVTPGTLLVATDGLFKYASHEAIIALLASQNDLEEIANALVQLAHSKSSGTLYDDLAFILVRVY